MAKDEATLEAELADAKAAYQDNPDDKTRAKLNQAKKAIIEARSQRRNAGITIGGDAFISNGNEG